MVVEGRPGQSERWVGLDSTLKYRGVGTGETVRRKEKEGKERKKEEGKTGNGGLGMRGGEEEPRKEGSWEETRKYEVVSPHWMRQFPL